MDLNDHKGYGQKPREWCVNLGTLKGFLSPYSGLSPVPRYLVTKKPKARFDPKANDTTTYEAYEELVAELPKIACRELGLHWAYHPQNFYSRKTPQTPAGEMPDLFAALQVQESAMRQNLVHSMEKHGPVAFMGLPRSTLDYIAPWTVIDVHSLLQAVLEADPRQNRRCCPVCRRGKATRGVHKNVLI
jgi:hypothetical protein